MIDWDYVGKIGVQIKETSVLEWIAILAGITEVFLAKANKVLLYPAGIISTSIFIYILQRAGLFAEAGLNLYYLIMSIYGWYIWHRRSNEAPLAITRTNASQWLIVAGIVLLGGGVQYAILRFFTESTVPLWDAFVSATAWAGMWLLARRKLENWILLNISNFAAIPLLFIKNLPLTGLLTLFLFFVAFQGYYSWKKEVHS